MECTEYQYWLLVPLLLYPVFCFWRKRMSKSPCVSSVSLRLTARELRQKEKLTKLIRLNKSQSLFGLPRMACLLASASSALSKSYKSVVRLTSACKQETTSLEHILASSCLLNAYLLPPPYGDQFFIRGSPVLYRFSMMPSYSYLSQYQVPYLSQ
jgi:hypothetical protein